MEKKVKVVYVSPDDCQVSLNIGREDGVKLGNKYLIYSLSDHEIIDPDTHKSLGFLEIVKGTGTVTHVQDTMCTITSNKTQRPSKKVIKRHSPFSSIVSGSIEETVYDGEGEVVPFDEPSEGNLAKQI